MSTFGEDRDKKIGQTPEEQGSDRPKGWKASLEHPIPTVRCNGATEKGVQCNKWSIEGSDKCDSHSTNLDKKLASERVMAGKLRLIGLIDPAIDTLQELLEPGTGEAVRLKAATEILDRSGIPKGQEMKVEIEHHNTVRESVERQLDEIRRRQQAEREDIVSVEEVENNGPDNDSD